MGVITLKKALDDYKTVHMPYRNFAERTRVEYLNDLRDFIGFLEKSGINRVGEIGLPIIERYVAGLEQKGFASFTRKRKVVAIRSFLSFLYQDGYIDTNLGIRVILPFTENTVPHVLTGTECNRIRIACSANTRDRAIIELLLQTGVTLSELVHLRLDDLELGKMWNGFIRVLGHRGHKERIITLDSKASYAINEYLSERKAEGSNILFLNRFNEPLGERGVQKMLRKYLRRARVEGGSIHTLRHTFGVRHIANGSSLKTIQEIMGLKHPRSGEVYLSLARVFRSKVLQATLFNVQ